MNRMSDMIDNVNTFTDLKPLSDEEFEFLEKVSETVRSEIAVPCSYCRYCVEHCPNDLPIADYFAMYNSDKQATNNTNFSITASSHKSMERQATAQNAENACNTALRALTFRNT